METISTLLATLSVNTIVTILIVLLVLKLAKTTLVGVASILVIGLGFIAIMAAIPFMPTSPPEQFDINADDMEYITAMQMEGSFDYDFAYNLFFGE